MYSTIITSIKNFLIAIVPIVLTGLDIISVEVLTIFIVIDVITGVLSVARRNGWTCICSKRFSFGVIFKLCLLLIPLVIVWMGKGIGLDLMILAVWSLNLLIVAEALSILGNIQEIKTGEELKEVDAVGMILKKVRIVFLRVLEQKR